MYSLILALIATVSIAQTRDLQPRDPAGRSCGLSGTLDERIKDCLYSGNYAALGGAFLVYKDAPTASHRLKGQSDRIYYIPHTKTFITGIIPHPGADRPRACRDLATFMPESQQFRKHWKVADRELLDATFHHGLNRITLAESTLHFWGGRDFDMIFHVLVSPSDPGRFKVYEMNSRGMAVQCYTRI